MFVKRNPTATGFSTKLQPAFREPFVVVEVELNDTYRINKLNDFKDRNFETTVRVSQMKLWRGDPFDKNDVNCNSDFENDSTSENQVSESEVENDNETVQNDVLNEKEKNVENDSPKRVRRSRRKRRELRRLGINDFT